MYKMVKSSSLHHSSKKLVSSAECSHPSILRPVKSFVLKSNNMFADRASDVFNSLNSLENDHSIWMANNETHQSFEIDDVAVNDTSDASKNDTFKKPYLPVRRNKKYGVIHKKKNMRVWRKYSLKDIPLSSDAKNAAVAFQFLNELRKKKEEKIHNETISDDGKVTFRKPGVKRNHIQPTLVSCKEVSSSSKIVDEKLSKNVSSCIKLDHLEDECEDE